MQLSRRTLPALALLSLCAGAFGAVAPSQAQSCEGLIFRAIQGNSEQSTLGFQPVRVLPNREGHIRAYWRSNSPDPYTLAVEYGHPSSFGYQGQPATKVRQHFRMNPQQPQQVQRGKVDFQAVNPGATTIGFRVIGSKSPSVFNNIPQRCRSGVLTVQVQGQQNQPQGNYGGGQGNYGGSNPGYNQGAQVPFIGGRYSSEFGELILNQDGNRVWGTYTHQQGQIEGTFDGVKLRGTWKQGPSYRAPNDAGDVELSFRGDQFTGVWRYGHQGPWEGNWGGRLINR